MKKETWKSIISSVLSITLIFCYPVEALAQSKATLSMGTQVILRVNEDFKAENRAENGTINAVIDSDVYSADGNTVLIKAGTPAFIEFNAEPNGSWGKAGRLCLTQAYTKTIDNKRIPLRLSSCKNGGSTLGGVIILSVLFFPLGLISGCMKGSMPRIQQNSTFAATVIQDITIE